MSGGLDAAPEYTYARSEIVRRGYAWVGVSAQMIGVEGGPVAVSVPQADAAGAGKGIKHIDPARYGDLVHPGDAFSYDIYTQVARSLRAPQGIDVLGPLTPQKVLAVGESQSAFALTTYVDGVQPLTHEFDGFVIHSRAGAASRSASRDRPSTSSRAITGPPTKFRTDGRAPIIVVQTETDVVGILGAYAARQPDSARFRWWETAGTAHADQFQVGLRAENLGCPAPVNNGPSRFVVRTALRDLDRWVRTGVAPPKAPRFAVDPRDEGLRARPVGQRGGRHPHAARRRAGRHALGGLGRRIDRLHPVRLHQAADRRSRSRSATGHATTTAGSTAPPRSGRSPPASCSPTTGPTS